MSKNGINIGGCCASSPPNLGFPTCSPFEHRIEFSFEPPKEEKPLEKRTKKELLEHVETLNKLVDLKNDQIKHWRNVGMKAENKKLKAQGKNEVLKDQLASQTKTIETQAKALHELSKKEYM